METAEVAYTAAGLELVGTIAFPDPADGPLPGLLIAHEGLDLLPLERLASSSTVVGAMRLRRPREPRRHLR